MKRLRTDATMFLLILVCSMAELHAEGTGLSVTKTLSFPADSCVGTLYVESESGLGWDPKRVCFSWEWKPLAPAQGNVAAPSDRRLSLNIMLALQPEDARRLRARNQRMHQMLVGDRVRTDPDDLSGLSGLDPNDLYELTVNAAGPQERYGRSRTGVYLSPDRFEDAAPERDRGG